VGIEIESAPGVRTTGDTMTGPLVVNAASIATLALSTKVQAEAFNRLEVGGPLGVYGLTFGDGASAPDTLVARAAPGSLAQLRLTPGGVAYSLLAADDNIATTASYIAGKSRGAIGANTPLLAGHALGSFEYQGYDGVAYVPGVTMGAVAEQNFSAVEHSTSLTFSTRSGAGALTQQMIISGAGRVSISAFQSIATVGALGAVERFRVGTPTTIDNTATVMLATLAANAHPLVVQGAAAQTANYITAQTSAGAIRWAVTSTGSTAITQASSIPALTSRVTGDAADRFQIFTDGTQTWGAGAVSGDVTLGRSLAGSLYTDATALDFSSATITARGNGSAALPTYAFATSSMGMFRSATGPSLGFAVGGVEVARMRSASFMVNSAAGTPGTVERLRVNTPVTADNTANVMLAANASADRPLVIQGAAAQTATLINATNSGGTTQFSVSSAGLITMADGANIAVNTTTGTRIGTATSQKLAFWNKTPVIQPTNAIAASAFVANTSAIANDTATFGGYTIGKIAAALIQVGILT